MKKIRLLAILLTMSMLTACGNNAEDTSANSQLEMHNSQSTVEESIEDDTLLVESSIEATEAPVETEVPENEPSEESEATASPIPDDYESDNNSQLEIHNSQSTENPEESETSDNYKLSIENSELVATATPAPTEAPRATNTPKPVATPEPTPVATAAPTPAPAPTEAPTATPEPTPVVTEAPAHICANWIQCPSDYVAVSDGAREDLGGGCYRVVDEYKEWYCSCGAVVKREVSSYDNHHNEVFTPGKAPTCTEAGYSAYITCDCGANNGTAVEQPATGHHLEEELGDMISRTENPDGTTTCVYEQFKNCTRCDYSETGTYTFTY